MQILVDEAHCSGCRACELACVVHHERRFGTATARIRILKVEAHGVDRPSLCRQCADAPCVAACAVDALRRDDVTGAILLSADDCIVCSACADACSFDALFVDAATGMPLICDLCAGDPACVKRCVTAALTVALRNQESGIGSPRATGPAQTSTGRAVEGHRV